jgi:hypothetical protein
MHEEEEAMPMESQAEPMEVEDDSPYLDLEGDRELQSYALIKDRVFSHTLAYDPDLLEKIAMDADFLNVWKAIGWEDVPPVWEEGSRLLTIQFFMLLQEIDNGISFRLF